MSDKSMCSSCGKRKRRAENQRYCAKCHSDSSRKYRQGSAETIRGLRARIVRLEQELRQYKGA